MSASNTGSKTVEAVGEGAVLRQLGDGLVLRRGRSEDAEALAAFTAEVVGPEPADEPIGVWTRDLMRGELPGFGPQDFTIVEDTGTGSIVATLNLISQTWAYEGIEFGAGRIELVGTHPDYRRRGLMRAQLETVHEWSVERGEMVQGITGIPWFYRQFGYELALEHMGGRTGYTADVPQLEQGVREPYRLRPATDADVPFLARLYRHATERYAVSCVRGEEMWRYELQGRSEGGMHHQDTSVIESSSGEPVGFVMHLPELLDGVLWATGYELVPGVSWTAVTPSVLRYTGRTGEDYANRDRKGELGSLGFGFGSEHPAYDAMGGRLPRVHRPYAWYVRVPDLPGFVRHVAPVLERRLGESFAAGHTGDLKLSFYDDGLRLGFKGGRLTAAEGWSAGERDNRVAPKERDALFPGLIFHQLLFGFRAAEELEHAFPDCIISSDHVRALLNVLFPKRPSRVWGVE